MSDENRLLTQREQVEIERTKAEAQHRIEEAKTLQSKKLLMELGFCFRWLIIWLAIGGFIKLELVKEMAKWISG